MVYYKDATRRWEEAWLIALMVAALAVLAMLARTAAGDEPIVPQTPQMVAVVSPMEGMFCAAPYPGARPYVEVGTEVFPDTIVGMIKPLMVDAPEPVIMIPAGVHGIVQEVLVFDEEPVVMAQPLMMIRLIVEPVPSIP